MRAVDIMTREVATVTPATPLTAIADLLLTRKISGVPVVEPDGRLAGVISEADLMWRAEEGEPRRSWWTSLLSGRSLMAADFIRTHGTRADDIMTRDVVSIDEDTPVEAIIDIFERRRIKRLPVVRDHRLVGLVSRSDLLRAMARRPPPLPERADDAALQQRLIGMLSDQQWFDPRRVNVTVENGAVRLSGLVGSETERRALHVAAHALPGEHTIEDDLTVGSTSPGAM